ncbi:hypothetical protein HLRTI_000672 [Halorhabdus tiamatea SARL4B]|uniref:Uncharacterized protein n=1 Tax=Halorhabdus tiamatea SARL4B TaxID=1033806 RepID=S6CU73_9EURY|nr:hypothetical protein [Halorhabdus tiamatea]ERJ07314.1 hypothetical protein HLRTI_000672 [Halorhabdus tiamatea SARL4B]CCQ34224.1 conserved hypothetical protein [Halorhabdus tiamatea SARL4B]
MTDAPSFTIPARPRRQYDRAGRLSYEGSVLFRLEPTDPEEVDLRALLETVLRTWPYRHGDFHDLPMVVYLVRDDETSDVFRVSIRDGALQLHVLPATETAGLKQFYGRLDDVSDTEWDIYRRVEAVPDTE